MSDFTPGPWEWDDSGITKLVHGEDEVLVPDGWEADGVIVSDADAALIAAAPEMYEALKSIADQDDIEMALDPQWAKRVARAALRKAEGKE